MRLHGQAAALPPTWLPSVETLGKRFRATWERIAEPATRLPLDATDATIYQEADNAARCAYKICALYMNSDAILYALADMCNGYGIPFPAGCADTEIIGRALDKSWWLRNLRKEHARRFENHQIKIGVTGKTDPYISRKSCATQAQRNKENQALLESLTMTNGVIVNGKEQTYTLAELAALGMANKANRRGELMTRIRGMEEIANGLNHAGMFWTITCPSKFHSVGGTNAKYKASGPREGQAYLCKIWARMRSALKRQGIAPYGFRIAEPHTDGCPHWHMLFFVPRHQVTAMKMVIYSHALREDDGEPGANKYRATCKMIRTGEGMSAAAYIAKYIAKNIDGYGVGQHTSTENGETYTIQTDLLGNEELTPSHRVTYWSQLHGIRQFQQIGGAPVGVWRELRRMEEATIATAPAEIQDAWRAAQKIDTGEKDENGDAIIKPADFAAYLRAQGGAATGRGHRIRLAVDVVTVEGKYATYDAEKPIGVYAVAYADEIYKSVRYTWTATGAAKLDIRAVAGAFDVPRTRVNNCTPATVKRWRDGTVWDDTALIGDKKERRELKNIGGRAAWIAPDAEKLKTLTENYPRSWFVSDRWAKAP